MKKLLIVALKSTAAYTIAQILTGIENGFIIAYLVLYKEMSVPEAVALTVPAMLPLMLIQLLLVYYMLERFINDKKRNSFKSSNLETLDSNTSHTNH